MRSFACIPVEPYSYTSGYVTNSSTRVFMSMLGGRVCFVYYMPWLFRCFHVVAVYFMRVYVYGGCSLLRMCAKVMENFLTDVS